MGISPRICSDCEKNILFFSKFKQACLANIIQLQASIIKAQSNKNSPAAQNENVEPGGAAKVVIRQNAVQISIKKDILKTNVPKPNPIQEKNNENYAVNNNVNVSSVNVNSIVQASDEVSVKEEKDVIQNNPEYFNDHVIKIENDNCEMNNNVNCNNVNETTSVRDNHEESIIKDKGASQDINCQNKVEISVKVKDDILEAHRNDIKLNNDIVRKTDYDNCKTSTIVMYSNSNININNTDHGNYEVKVKKENVAIQDIYCQSVDAISIKHDVINKNPNDSKLYDGHVQEMKNKNSDIANNIDEMKVDNDFHLTSIMKKQCGKGSMEIFVKEETSNILINVPEQERENENCKINNTTNSNNVNNTDHVNYGTSLENEKTAPENNHQTTQNNSIIYDIHEENSNDYIYDEVNVNIEDDVIQDMDCRNVEKVCIKHGMINENPNNIALYDNLVQETKKKNSDTANNIDDEMEVKNYYHLTSIMKKQCEKGHMEIFIKEESSNNLINREQERENENCKINNTANSNKVSINNTDYMNNETSIETEKTALEINCENAEKNSVTGNILEENSNDCLYSDVMKKKCEKGSMEIFIKAEIPNSIIKREQEIQNRNCNINNIVNSNIEEYSIDRIYEDIMKKQCGKGSMEILIKEEIANSLIKREEEMENENCKISNYVNSNHVNLSNTDHMNNETSLENEKAAQKINCRNKEKRSIKDIVEINPNDRTYDDVIEEMHFDDKINDNVTYCSDTNHDNKKTYHNHTPCSEIVRVQNRNTTIIPTFKENEGKQDKNTASERNDNDTFEEIHNSHKLSGELILKVNNKKRKHDEIDTHNYTHEASRNDAQNGKTNTTQAFDCSISQFDNAKKRKKNNNSASEIHDLNVEEIVIEEGTEEENSTDHNFFKEQNKYNTNKHNINCMDENVIHANHNIWEKNINKAHSGKVSETQTFDIPIQINEDKESKKDNSTESEIDDLTLEDNIIEVAPNNSDTHKVNISKVESGKINPIKASDVPPIIQLDEDDNSNDNNSAPEIHDLTLEEIFIREDIPYENPTGNKLCNEPTRGVSNKDCETNKNNYNNVNNTDNSTTQAFDISTTQLDNQRKNKKLTLEINDRVTKLKCSVCHKKFSNDFVLRKHMLNHSSFKVFICDVCKKVFTSNKELNLHKKEHFQNKVFRCYICFKVHTSQDELDVHIKREHVNNTGYSCNVCHKMFSNHFILRKHMMNHSSFKVFMCDICKNVFTSNKELNLHKKYHFENKVFRCYICFKVHTSQDELDVHIKREHVNNSGYSCHVCHKMFKFKSVFKLHVQLHR